jgi:hypothetical protein
MEIPALFWFNTLFIAQSRTGTLTMILVGKYALKTSFAQSLAADSIGQTLIAGFQS